MVDGSQLHHHFITHTTDWSGGGGIYTVKVTQSHRVVIRGEKSPSDPDTTMVEVVLDH
jgi:hypothetical protein